MLDSGLPAIFKKNRIKRMFFAEIKDKKDEIFVKRKDKKDFASQIY